jgi:hypothetical protein
MRRDWQMLWMLLIALIISWLPALISANAVMKTSDLYELSQSPNPYFQPEQAGLLYILTPLVVISSFMLFLSPGMLLSLLSGQVRKFLELPILGFGISLAVAFTLGTLVKIVFQVPFTKNLLIPLWIACAFLGWLGLGYQLKRGVPITWPSFDPNDVRRIGGISIAVFAGLAVLVPKIYWENFNLDGIEAFEFGRSLITHVLPHWEIQDGIFGFYNTFVLFAYPNHWFTALFGPLEAAARLPFFLYLFLLFCLVILLVEFTSHRQLSIMEELSIWLGMMLFTVVQTYNTNYEPFFADLAENAATDTLAVVVFLSAIYFLLDLRFYWFGIFGLMTYLASPGGLLLLGCVAGAIIISQSQEKLHMLKPVAGLLLVGIIVSFLYEVLYNPIIVGGVNNQFSGFNMLRRFYPPTLTEFNRLNALVFAGGVVPVISMFLIRRDDLQQWILAITTLVYFGILYIQIWTSLHQFTLIMLLPPLVFWRYYLRMPDSGKRWILPIVTIATLTSVILSLPPHFQINQSARRFGQATDFRIGDYEQDYETAIKAGSGFASLIPTDYRLHYPNQPWGADAPSLIYYSFQEKSPVTEINYIIQADNRS